MTDIGPYSPMGNKTIFKTCRTEWCNRWAVSTTGYCKICTQNINQRTSDGTKHRGNVSALTVSQCKEIKRLSSQFKSNKEIGLTFGISQNTVAKVLKGTYNPRPDEDSV